MRTLSPEVQNQVNAVAGCNGFDAAAAVMFYEDVVAQRDKLLTELKAMREEIDQIQGYWTERLDTLAQAADSLIAEVEAA